MSKYPLNIAEIRALRNVVEQERAYRLVDDFLRQPLDKINESFPDKKCRDQFSRLYHQFTDEFVRENPEIVFRDVYGPVYYSMQRRTLEDLPSRCFTTTNIKPQTVELARLERKRRFFDDNERQKIFETFFPEGKKEFKLNPFIRLDFIHSLQNKQVMGNDYLDSFRGMEVFYKTSGEILANPEALEVIKDGELTVLVVASGSHLAPLQVAFGLIDRQAIHKAKFTFTEVNPSFLARIDDQLTRLQTLGVISDYKDENITIRSCSEQSKECKGEGTETEFNFKYQGKPVQILFALNRSGGNFWRPEYVKEADLIIYHDFDIPNWDRDNFGNRYYNYEMIRIAQHKDPFRTQLFLGESGKIDDISYVNRKQLLHYKLTTISGRYGHEELFARDAESQWLGFRKNGFALEFLSDKEGASLFVIEPKKK